MGQVCSWVAANPTIVIFGALTLIQIVPIKINPWSAIFKWIRSALIGDVSDKLSYITSEFENDRVKTKRWRILEFANTVRQGRKHTKEEWDHCLDELAWYEHYCATHKITNGVMKECSAYIRDTYRELLHNNAFL